MRLRPLPQPPAAISVTTPRTSVLGSDRLGVPFCVIAAAVVFLVGPPDLRLRDDVVAPEADEVGERLPSAIGVHLEKVHEALVQFLDDVGPDRMVEHGGRADLHGAAAEEEIIQRVLERRDAANAREALVRERLRQLRDLGERQRKNRRSAQPAGRYESIDMDLEVERLW